MRALRSGAMGGREWDERCLVYIKREGALVLVQDLGGVRFVPLLRGSP